MPGQGVICKHYAMPKIGKMAANLAENIRRVAVWARHGGFLSGDGGDKGSMSPECRAMMGWREGTIQIAQGELDSGLRRNDGSDCSYTGAIPMAVMPGLTRHPVAP